MIQCVPFYHIIVRFLRNRHGCSRTICSIPPPHSPRPQSPAFRTGLLQQRRTNSSAAAAAAESEAAGSVHEARLLPLRRAQGEAPRRPLPRLSPLRQPPSEEYIGEPGMGEAVPVRDPRARQAPPRRHRGNTSKIVSSSSSGAHPEED